tara:strand:+ start:354 stop:674 length:321 start_codon:yes stop_codon:yes gene_type:complete
MDDKDLDRLLQALKNKDTLPEPGAFESGVWRKIRQIAPWQDRVMAGLRKLAPPVAWRAAPAALALVIGGISGAAMAAPETHDELDVFRSSSPYMITSKLNSQESRH